jgi:ubiquinone/menaquinone biosynthesis C-methylase UbiE
MNMPKDLFSKQASLYARYRPVYPAGLFEYVLSFVHQKNIAWDCATGNGQAALVLADHFKKVYATDISEKQLQQAREKHNIVYSVAAAERTQFPGQLFDCITVAQAYHWFDFAAFQQELLRVAKPGAILAVWGYSLVICEDETIDRRIKQFYREVVGPYWDKERKFVDDHYTTVPFPYEELTKKEFAIDVQWTPGNLEGYLNTWSSVQHFIRQNNYNPVTGFCESLQSLWQDDKPRKFYFPVFLRIGKVS